MALRWKDWKKEKPKDEPGLYLVWSERYGIRLIKDHPSWWNLPARKAGREPGPRVRFWVKVAEHGIGLKLRAASRRGEGNARRR